MIIYIIKGLRKYIRNSKISVTSVTDFLYTRIYKGFHGYTY